MRALRIFFSRSLFVFWKNWEYPKIFFEIYWPLVTYFWEKFFCRVIVYKLYRNFLKKKNAWHIRKIKFFSGNPKKKLLVQVRSGSASTGSGQVRFGFSLAISGQVRSGLNIFKLFLHSTGDHVKNSLSDFCTYALLKVLEINLLCIFTHHSKMQKDDWTKYIPNFSFKWS